MNHQPTDEELLSAIRATAIRGADSGAMQTLVERHGAYLFGVARSLCRDDAEAEDVVQESLMALLSAKFGGKSSARTFMVSIVIRQAALARRKRRGWLRFVGGYDETPPKSTSQQSTESSELSIDARLDLAQLLEGLSPEHREVIVMRELEGMTYEEMAGALQVPRGTVESRLSRARQQLQALWMK